MYELRAPVNYAFGLLTNACAISDTTLVSSDFTSLPSGLSTTTYLPITVQDPATHTYEVIWVTGHAADSNTITAVRGREGTSARAWPSASMWTCAPTLRDAVLPIASATMLPADAHIGMRVCQQDTQQILIWAGAAGWALEVGKGILGLIKRNTADSVTSVSNTMFETLTIPGLKASRWYKAVWTFGSNATGTVNPPNSSANIHLSASGATVTTADPQIRTQTIINQTVTSPGVVVETVFNVPSDGTYQLGCSANSGGSATTLNILASGAASNANAANKRCFWVEDMGLK